MGSAEPPQFISVTGNERVFFCPAPPLQLLLSLHRHGLRSKRFLVQYFFRAILFRETCTHSPLMLAQALLYAIRDPDIVTIIFTF